MKTLIVYYSKSGTTKLIADKLATHLNADTERLIETKTRKGIIDTIFLFINALLRRPTPINNLQHQVAEYDLVVIGTPVWWWTMSTPVRTFINKYKQDLKQVAFFCTMGGGGDFHAFQDMKKISGLEPIAELALLENAVKDEKYENDFLNFAEKLINNQQ